MLAYWPLDVMLADADDMYGMFCGTADSEMNPQDPEKKRTAPQSPKKRGRAAGVASQQVADGVKALPDEKPGKRKTRAGVCTRQLAGGDKKCAKCKKELPFDDFNADQASCKECLKTHRNLRQLAQRNAELTWFDNLNETERNRLVKAYAKEKKDAEREGKKQTSALRISRKSSRRQKAHGWKANTNLCGTENTRNWPREHQLDF